MYNFRVIYVENVTLKYMLGVIQGHCKQHLLRKRSRSKRVRERSRALLELTVTYSCST